MKIIITVTKEDILLGRRVHCDKCPVALALMRALPESTLYVLGSEVIIDEVWVALPKKACNFINDFDHGIPVSPFQFTLDFDDKKKGHHTCETRTV